MGSHPPTLTPLTGNAPAGAGFTLDRPAPRDAHIELSNGWSVDVVAQARTVIARGSDVGSYEKARDDGLDAVQEALDLFSVQNNLALVTETIEELHFAWWREVSKTIFRLVAVSDRHVTVGSGRSPKQAEWHPSFRYFRMAQTTSDLINSYRNLYLALESILTDIVPQNPPENESTWLKRALQQIEPAISLARYAPPGAGNAGKRVYRDIYDTMRNGMFHAKKGRRALLPQRAADRPLITATLDRLTRLYLDLLTLKFGVIRGGGVMTLGGFELLMRPLFSEAAEIVISDDDSPTADDDDVVNPRGGRLIRFSAHYESALDQPSIKHWIGELAEPDLQSAPDVRRFGLILDSKLVQIERAHEALDLGSLDCLQIQLGQRLVNTNIHKSIFGT